MTTELITTLLASVLLWHTCAFIRDLYTSKREASETEKLLRRAYELIEELRTTADSAHVLLEGIDSTASQLVQLRRRPPVRTISSTGAGGEVAAPPPLLAELAIDTLARVIEPNGSTTWALSFNVPLRIIGIEDRDDPNINAARLLRTFTVGGVDALALSATQKLQTSGIPINILRELPGAAVEVPTDRKVEITVRSLHPGAVFPRLRFRALCLEGDVDRLICTLPSVEVARVR